MRSERTRRVPKTREEKHDPQNAKHAPILRRLQFTRIPLPDCRILRINLARSLKSPPDIVGHDVRLALRSHNGWGGAVRDDAGVAVGVVAGYDSAYLDRNWL